jgi:hypothetical protein
MPTETDIAYCAGLVDGEACIRIHKSPAYKCQGRVNPAYSVRIQLRMIDENAIKFLSETFGGWYYREKAHVNNGRPLFCFQAADLAAEKIIRQLLPYLRVKRPAAETALTLRELQAEGRKHRTKPTGERELMHWSGKPVKIRNMAFSDEYIARCEALYQKSKDLNRVGAR